MQGIFDTSYTLLHIRGPTRALSSSESRSRPAVPALFRPWRRSCRIYDVRFIFLPFAFQPYIWFAGLSQKY